MTGRAVLLPRLSEPCSPRCRRAAPRRSAPLEPGRTHCGWARSSRQPGGGRRRRRGRTVVVGAIGDRDRKVVIKPARAGQVAPRLYSGDPFLFCPAGAAAAACAKARVTFEIVPGVSAATAVPAYAGIPLTTDVTGD